MPTTYTEEFKKAAVEKVLGRGKRSVDEIVADLGSVCKTTLVRWVKEFGTIPPMKLDETNGKGKRSQDYSAEEKLSAVAEFRRLAADPSAQGEYLRKQGLYTPTIEAWERDALGALEIATRRPKRSADEIQKDRKIVELERDLLRKDRALAETAALLVLKKKAESIWGLVDDEESA
jgi:transposase-like protein